MTTRSRGGRPARRSGADAVGTLRLVTGALLDRKAVDPLVLDLRGLTAATDYFVIVSGTSDAHVRGMAAQLLSAIGVETSAAAVAEHYGSRRAGGVLDGWLVDVRDEAAVSRVEEAGIACRAVPLMMTDPDATAAMVREAYALAGTTERAGGRP